MNRFTAILLYLFFFSFLSKAQTSLIPFHSTWKYLDNGSDQGTAWRSPSFNDSAWKSGQAKLGYGIPDAATVVSYGTSSSKKYITTYFRKTISIADASIYASFQAQVNRDDGVVVYVNDQEVFRDNMSQGTITYTTRAPGTTGGDDGATPIPFSVPASAFVNGENTIAVEIHQASPSSSDIAFDLELTGTASNPPPPGNNPPTVNLTSPSDGTSIELGQAVSISAQASDPEGKLASVEFYANGTSLGKDVTSPYSISWTAPTEGSYSITAKATDAEGASATSQAVSVTVTPKQTEPPQDLTPPSIVSINRYSPSTSTTTASSVTFRVSFSEPVTGVDASDFSLTALSGNVAGSLASSAVVSATADGASYNVTVSSITGTGQLRLDLKASGTSISDSSGNALQGGYTSGQTYTIEQQQQPPTPEGFETLTLLDPVSVSTNTGEKPQSKVWKYDGKHWAVLPNTTGTYLWRLDGKRWTNVLQLSTKSTSKADCKLIGNDAHILLYQGRSSQMVSVEYNAASGTYQLWSKRTSTVGLTFDSGVETATLDIDSKGRMWLASDGSNTINVRWSDSPYNNWSAPITIASNVSSDDICAITAMPGKIGVIWSNQVTKRFGFKTHADGASPSSWSGDEEPASQSAQNVGSGMADDHLNMAVASDGTLYCAAKTGYDSQGYPEVVLLVRRTSGSWDNLYTVAPVGTRPIVILNEAKDKIRVVYTSGDTGGNILYRESSFSNISFSSQLTLISGSSYNNTTSTKDNFTDDIVILASSSSQAVGVLASDILAPPQEVPGVPTLVSPADLATDVSTAPTLTWTAPTGAATYQAQVSTVSGFTSTVYNQNNLATTSAQVSGLAENTTYYWRVRASNTAGTSNWSSVWSFKTKSGSNPPQTGNTLVAHWKMDEGSGTLLSDATGTGNDAQTIGNPTWVSGVQGTALYFNGSQYATAPDNTSLDITGAITLAAWIKPEKRTTQYIIKKAENGQTDGYELSLSSAGEVFFRINQNSSGNNYRLNSTIPYPTDGNTWMHVAASYDGKVIKIYINGVQNISQTLNNPPAIATNTLALTIGAEPSGNYKFRGTMDDARIYNAALNASEISALATGSTSLNASSSSSFKAAIPEKALQVEMEVYPNPFTSNATLNFALPEDGAYSILLYDSKGAKVRVLQQGSAAAGERRTVNIDGKQLSKGLYFTRLQTANYSKTLRVVLTK